MTCGLTTMLASKLSNINVISSFFRKCSGNFIFIKNAPKRSNWPKYNYNQERSYAMRLELTEYGIIWKRPEYIPSWKPEKSGDLALLENIDKSKPIISLKCIEEQILKADKPVQDLLSISFSKSSEVMNKAQYNMIKKVQRHKYDTESPEAKIAKLTAKVRYFQELIPKNPRKTRMRVMLQETIDRRNKKLRQLRRVDYKCFEWLLEELQIVFKPTPSDPEAVTRKSSLVKLVDMHCEKIIESKLARYQMHLEAQQESFLKEKKETLKWIAETENKLGLPISVEIPLDNSELLQLSDGHEDTNKDSVVLEGEKDVDAGLAAEPKLDISPESNSVNKNIPES